MISAKPNVLDADIASLFAKQCQHVSPDDLDKRILQAAEFAVRGVTSESYPPVTVKKHRFKILVIVLLISALMYPLAKRFLELPGVVQNSSRFLHMESAASSDRYAAF